MPPQTYLEIESHLSQPSLDKTRGNQIASALIGIWHQARDRLPTRAITTGKVAPKKRGVVQSAKSAQLQARHTARMLPVNSPFLIWCIMSLPPRLDLSAQLIALLPDLARLARHLTGNRAQAEDLCQEVFLKLWARPDQCAAAENLRAYTMAVLRNQYRQNLRGMRTEPLPDDDALQTELPRAFASIALSELQAAIARLPASQARLIRLVIAGETSPNSLADLTGLPRGTVMSRLARARASLRQEMGLTADASVTELT